MQTMEVPVYIDTANVDSASTQRLKSLFDNPLFLLNVVAISPPTASQAASSALSNEDFQENYRVLWILSDAKKRYPNDSVILVKENSTSNASPADLADAVSAAVVDGQADVVYLGRWLDECGAMTNFKSISGINAQLATSQGPQGLQAVLFTPKARDMILGQSNMLQLPASVNQAAQNMNAAVQSAVGRYQTPTAASPAAFPSSATSTTAFPAATAVPTAQQVPLAAKPAAGNATFDLKNQPIAKALQNAIMSKAITAYVYNPNLIDYDISAATGPADYAKLNQCRDGKSNMLQSSSGSFWAWILIILLILLILWAFFSLGKTNKQLDALGHQYSTARPAGYDWGLF